MFIQFWNLFEKNIFFTFFSCRFYILKCCNYFDSGLNLFLSFRTFSVLDSFFSFRLACGGVVSTERGVVSVDMGVVSTERGVFLTERGVVS